MARPSQLPKAARGNDATTVTRGRRRFKGGQMFTPDTVAEIASTVSKARDEKQVFKFVESLTEYFDLTSVVLILRAAKESKLI